MNILSSHTTLHDAIDCFVNTNIDYLYSVQEKMLISRKK